MGRQNSFRRALCVRAYRGLGYSQCRFVTPPVPDVEDFHAWGFLTDVVEDTVGTKHDLAQCSSGAARLSGTNKWEGCQNANVMKYAPPELNGCLRIILGDISASLLPVRNRRV